MKKALLVSMVIAVFAVGMPAQVRAAQEYPLDRAGEFVATNPVTKTVCITPFAVMGDFFSFLLAGETSSS